MKVHITLKDTFRKDAQAKQAALRDLERTTGLTGVNLRRFERYGIISADIEPHMLPVAERCASVQAVEPDEQKFASRESPA